jgi:hypothetical protein
MTIGVCIATFGDPQRWGPLASRARISVDRQTLSADAVHYVHGETLASARNEAALRCETDHLIFLDADDELDPAYIESMARVVEGRTGPELVQPATRGFYPNGREDPYPVLIPRRPLMEANYLVIGTMIRRWQFLHLGGFQEWEMYEDWDLWIRATRDGAEVLAAPGAVYRVCVTEAGRNNNSRDRQVAVYNAIRETHMRRA